MEYNNYLIIIKKLAYLLYKTIYFILYYIFSFDQIVFNLKKKLCF